MQSTVFSDLTGVNSAAAPTEPAALALERDAFERSAVAAVLPHLGFISIRGADAITFMHGQLTNDVKQQTTSTVRYSAFCQAKGRMLASFLQWRGGDPAAPTVELALSRDLVAPIMKRLAMFVLRAKVELHDVSEQRVAFGWLGSAADGPALPSGAPDLPQAVLDLARNEGLNIVRMSDAAQRRRYLIIADAMHAEAVWRALLTTAQAVGAWLWRWSDLRAGVPTITAANQEQFVPQMVNFELIGGVNFKKGCYPGQEVVARSQYLGKLRRRMFLSTADVAGIQVGDDVEQPGAAEPVGQVVNAEPNGRGGTDLLIQTTLAASEGALTVRGGTLTLLTLPYAIPAEQSAE